MGQIHSYEHNYNNDSRIYVYYLIAYAIPAYYRTGRLSVYTSTALPPR